MGKGGARVGFRVTDRITIFRPCGCLTGILVLLGMPGVWLVLLGLFVSAGPGFGHWLAEFALTMFSIMVVSITIMALVVFVTVRNAIREQRRIEAKHAAFVKAAEARKRELLQEVLDIQARRDRRSASAGGRAIDHVD